MTKSYRLLLIALALLVTTTLGYYGARYFLGSKTNPSPTSLTTDTPTPQSDLAPTLPPPDVNLDPNTLEKSSITGRISCQAMEPDENGNDRCQQIITTDTGEIYYLATDESVNIDDINQLAPDSHLSFQGSITNQIIPGANSFIIDSYKLLSE